MFLGRWRPRSDGRRVAPSFHGASEEAGRLLHGVNGYVAGFLTPIADARGSYTIFTLHLYLSSSIGYSNLYTSYDVSIGTL